MPSSNDPRFSSQGIVLSGNSIAALAMLRQQAFPLIAPPRFGPREQTIEAAPGWLRQRYEQMARQAPLGAAVAAVVLLLAVTLPVWSAMRAGGTTNATHGSLAVHSSAGVTGTAGTRTEDIGATTFLGAVPFLQQLRYYDALTGASPAGHSFVQGAREGSIVDYMQTVGTAATFSYLNSAVQTKTAIENYAAALKENERKAALLRQQERSPVGVIHSWSAPPIAAGTRFHSTITFYACVGNGFCGNMASGQAPFAGAAACSANLPFGTRFTIANDPSGRVFTCLDRGALSATWVDVWFYDIADGYAWQSLVGSSGDIIIQ